MTEEETGEKYRKLHYFVIEGKWSKVRKFLTTVEGQEQITVQDSSFRRQTPLHILCRLNSEIRGDIPLDIAKSLFHPDIHFLKDRNGDSLLHGALRGKGDIRLVRMILSYAERLHPGNGAVRLLGSRNEFMHTPFHYATQASSPMKSSMLMLQYCKGLIPPCNQLKGVSVLRFPPVVPPTRDDEPEPTTFHPIGFRDTLGVLPLHWCAENCGTLPEDRDNIIMLRAFLEAYPIGVFVRNSEKEAPVECLWARWQEEHPDTYSSVITRFLIREYEDTEGTGMSRSSTPNEADGSEPTNLTNEENNQVQPEVTRITCDHHQKLQALWKVINIFLQVSCLGRVLPDPLFDMKHHSDDEHESRRTEICAGGTKSDDHKDCKQQSVTATTSLPMTHSMPKPGWYPVHEACRLVPSVFEPFLLNLALVLFPEEVKVFDNRGRLPLHIAVSSTRPTWRAILEPWESRSFESEIINAGHPTDRYGAEILRGLTPTDVAKDNEDSNEDVSGLITTSVSEEASDVTKYSYYIRSIVQVLMDMYPQAARTPEREKGRLPLALAVENGMTYDEMRPLVMAVPESISTRDTKTHMYPCMIAAIETCNNLDTVWKLLRFNPAVIRSGTFAPALVPRKIKNGTKVFIAAVP